MRPGRGRARALPPGPTRDAGTPRTRASRDRAGIVRSAPFGMAAPGETIRGTDSEAIQLASGRYALVEIEPILCSARVACYTNLRPPCRSRGCCHWSRSSPTCSPNCPSLPRLSGQCKNEGSREWEISAAGKRHEYVPRATTSSCRTLRRCPKMTASFVRRHSFWRPV